MGPIANCNRNFGVTAEAIRASLGAVLADRGGREQTQPTQQCSSSPNANAEVTRHLIHPHGSPKYPPRLVSDVGTVKPNRYLTPNTYLCQQRTLLNRFVVVDTCLLRNFNQVSAWVAVRSKLNVNVLEYDQIADWYTSERFKQNCPEAIAVRGVIQSCPFADGVFQAAVAWGVMFHLNPEDAIHAIRSVSRTLRLGAAFLFTSGDEDGFEGQEGKMNGVTFRYFSYSVSSYRHILGDHGFTLVDVHRDSGKNTYYLARKAETVG